MAADGDGNKGILTRVTTFAINLANNIKSQYGVLVTLVIILFVLLFLAGVYSVADGINLRNPFKDLSSDEQLPKDWIKIGIGFFLITAGVVGILRAPKWMPKAPKEFLKETPNEASIPLKVIGWEGVETLVLDDQFFHLARDALKDDITTRELACLVTPRSLADLPHFFYQRTGFDEVVADIEFLHRYDDNQLLHNLHPNPATPTENPAKENLIAAIDNNIDDNIIALVDETLLRSGKRLGVPLQFGFMEVLMSEKLYLEKSIHDTKDISYKDLCISKLLEEGINVGLWHWYLPTLYHLLLTETHWQASEEEPTPNESAETQVTRHPALKNVKNFVDLVESSDGDASLSSVEDVIETIRNEKYQKQISLIKGSLAEIRYRLNKGSVDIVFGSSSSVLKREDFPRIRAVVPQEGVLIWVTCGAILNTLNKPFAVNTRFLEWLISRKTQEQLSKYDDYRGCPVEKGALKIARKESDQGETHPALPTLMKIFSQKNGQLEFEPEFAIKTGRVSVRAFPKDWRGWEKCWEEFVRGKV